MKATNTNISWITSPGRDTCEWRRYRKSFVIDRVPTDAAVRFESDATCAVFVNGEFLVSGTGRYPERVNCHAVTSRLHPGENTLEILLGGHYFQKFAFSVKEQRGYFLNQAALELTITWADGSTLRVPTDDTWEIVGLAEKPLISMQLTQAEYDTMWKNAALWQETEDYRPVIPAAVASVAGDAYTAYAEEKIPLAVSCETVAGGDMTLTDGVYTPKTPDTPCSIIFDMGRLVVGYVELDYSASAAVTVDQRFDYSESTDDFAPNSPHAATVERISVTETLAPETHFYRNYRRRAFRFVKLTFSGRLDGFSLTDFRVRQCLFPVTEKGYFSCSDEMLNRAWEMGKYTLHVNKQQEYESCPRREMLFFAGDGAIDAKIDIYAFGNCDMLNTSLSIKHEINATGVSTTPKFNRTVWQWDYYAWRIICIYNYFRHTGDQAFLARHYGEACTNIAWLTERMNDRNLLFQIPAFHSTFASVMIQVDWACSLYRMGENVFLNCLLYRALVCMAELAEELQQTECASEWHGLAARVKAAINTHLWDAEKQAYIDSLSEVICQDANTLAVLFDVADAARGDAALETMKRTLWSSYGAAMANEEIKNRDLRGGSCTVSPMMSALEAEAHFLREKPEDGLSLIRRVWGAMLEKGATTFWEFAPNSAEGRWDAPCHAWSAGCTYLLSGYILGIRPTAPRWEACVFSPRPCDLTDCCGVVPTPHGLIAASFAECDGAYTYRIAIPRAITLTVDLPTDAEIEILKY